MFIIDVLNFSVKHAENYRRRQTTFVAFRKRNLLFFDIHSLYTHDNVLYFHIILSSFFIQQLFLVITWSVHISAGYGNLSAPSTKVFDKDVANTARRPVNDSSFFSYLLMVTFSLKQIFIYRRY